MTHKCDRCSGNDATDVQVPDFFQDRYVAICDDCAFDLNRLQARLEP